MSAPDYITPLLEAVAHQEAGRLDAASAGFDHVLAIEPQQPQALLFGGLLASRAGHMTRALDLLARATTARPAHAESHFAFGNALWNAGRKQAARAAWEDALRHQRRHLGALLNLARAQEDAGEFEAAVASCREAVAAAPQAALPRAALAAALRADGQLASARREAEHAVAADPALAQAQYQLGTTLKALGERERASASLREAIRLAPGDASSHLNLANVLSELGDTDAAEQHCRRAIALDPAMAEAHAVLAYLLTQQNRLPEAIAAGSEAVHLDPDLPEGHWNRGIALLSAGDLPAGFAEYEWRKRHVLYRSEFRSLPAPEWTGGPVAGKRVLILAEQGLGDAIMFVRYAEMLEAAGAVVTLACDRRLIPLLHDAPGVHHIVANGRDLPAHDVWVDQMSLPLCCGTTLDSIPRPSRPLASDPARTARWAERLGPSDTRRIGVVWAGNPGHSNDSNRSCPIDVFQALAGRVDMVSLQVGPRAAEAAALGIQDWSSMLTDYAETAAAVAHLDLVITVDTSVAHLAASMGKPTWVLLPYCPDWRWLQHRPDSPWYSSITVFRQPAPNDWTSLTHALTALLVG